MRFGFLILVVSVSLFADDLSHSFPKGKGSRFVLKMDGISSDVSILVADSSPTSVNIEYYISGSRSLLPVELWQQYKLSKRGGARLQIVEGYQMSNGWKNPERMDATSLSQLEAKGLGDFLLSESDNMGALKVGEEEVLLPAGKTKATHFRQTRDGSTTDFWVSNEAKPISLVQLKSSGKANYSLVLDSLISNAVPKIIPQNAVAPSAKGKELFQIPVGLSGLP